MNVAISVQDVSMRFGKSWVLRDVSHDFEEGKIHGIVGNNGSGKTRFDECICGFPVANQGQGAGQLQTGRAMTWISPRIWASSSKRPAFCQTFRA